MTEITPLLKQDCDEPRYNAAPNNTGDVEGEQEEFIVHEAESEIPLLEIVKELFLEWQRNGSNENLTPQDIMAMHLQYRRVTRGRQVFHDQHAIMSELARAMLRWKRLQAQFYIDSLQSFILGRNILKNLEENWQSIIQFNEDLSRNLNVYRPPTCRERIQNAWVNFKRKFIASKSFILELVFIIILLCWPLSLLFMGAKYLSQCSMNSFLPEAVVLTGIVGILALSLRLLLLFIEKCCWFRMRTVISHFLITMKLMEFVYMLALIIELWFNLRESPSFDYEDSNFCKKTFYTFMIWMRCVSSFIAMIWLAANVFKTVSWMTRIRFQYMPLFDEDSEIHL